MLSTELILASASPRRIELLQMFAIDFEIHPAKAPEPDPTPHETPADFAARAALCKAQEVAETLQPPSAWILAADTIVVLDDTILGKPRSPQEAHTMLSQLQGRSHNVYTGFALLHHKSQTVHHEAVQTTVWFRSLAEEQIRRYVDSGDPMDKAGAYGIQTRGSCLVARIEGCYFNVVGLPISRIAQVLEMHQLGSLL